MGELVAHLAGEADFSAGSAVLEPLTASGLFSIAPFRGRTAEVAAALGVPLEIGRVVATGTGRLIWVGFGQWFLEGAAPALGEAAAVTDQSDAWFGTRLTGADSAAVLARLTPIDLDPKAFAVGQVARTMLGHMHAIIIAIPNGYEILVMRSFAGTALHDLETAMKAVAARYLVVGSSIAAT